MKKSNSAGAFLIICIVVLSGCKALNLRIAENYYDEYAFSKAIPKYEKVLRKSFNAVAASRLADSYRKTGNSLKAEIWYRRLAASHVITLQDKLNFAEVLMENGKYDEAKIWFGQYLELNTSDKRVRRLVQACDSIHLFFEDTTVYSISQLKLNKGTESNFSPAFYKDGLVFLSDRSAPGKKKEISMWTGKGYLDLFYTKKSTDDTWVEPVLLKGDINGMYDEGPAVFNSIFNEVYFTRTDYTGKTIGKNLKNESTLKLFQGKLINDQWVLQSLLPFNNRDYSVGHPALSPDGNTLFFVSDMPWGYGGTDIYKVTMSNGKWSNPENLGSNINSEGNEMFPFFASDSVLYFSSDGHVGLGGLDIYSVYMDEDKWSKPENLQYPVNSSKDDFGFIIDPVNNIGYFSSNRKKNQDMIFGFTKNPPVFSFELEVSESNGSKPMKSFDLLLVSKKGELQKTGTGSNGKFSMKLNSNTEYNMVIKSHGYYAERKFISTVGVRKSIVFTDEVQLNKIDLNKAVVWKEIKFNRKEDDLITTTIAVLDSLAGILTMNPEMQIEIISHTDSRGTYSDNFNLSKRRAESIVAYLVTKGISQRRVFPVGYGEGKLLNGCRDGIFCIEEDHQVNNRIEIRTINLLN